MRAIGKSLLCCWLWLCFFHFAFAGSLTSPKVGSSQALVISYTPDPDGSTSSGELSITVATLSGAAATADRNLEVVLYISGQFGKSIAYPIQITLPQGAITATTKLHYLQPQGYGQWVVDVFEDGRSIVRPKSIPSSLNNQQRKTWLEITSTGAGQPSFQIDYGLAGFIPATIGMAGASADWRAYLAFDAVAIPQSQLAIAAPAQIEALMTYVLAGGIVVVHSANNSATSELDRLTGLTSQSSETESPDTRWEKISTVHRDFGFKRSHGAGQLIAFEQAPSNVGEHIKSSIQFPLSDFALSGDTDFRWFWRNLVQSVGTAPVWGFIVFVTLFVIFVGPVLLRVTTKMQHRTLLLFLVPALSMIATLLVLFYNVVREGFGTYGRIASVQFHDDRSGHGFTWSRQSYFSGAPPREGLRFPLGAFIKPVDGETFSGRYYYDPRENVACTIRSDGESQLVTGWLLPRNQQQIMIGQRTDQTKLPIKITRGSDMSVSVTNLTEQPIPLLYLRESIQACYFAEGLQPGQTQELTAESAGKIDSLLRLKMKYEPQEPAAIDVNSLRYYGYYYNNRNQTSDPIDNATKRLTCSRLSDYGFWILLEQAPDITLPLDRSVYSQEKHFHIMTGVGQW